MSTSIDTFRHKNIDGNIMIICQFVDLQKLKIKNKKNEFEYFIKRIFLALYTSLIILVIVIKFFFLNLVTICFVTLYFKCSNLKTENLTICKNFTKTTIVKIR